MAETVTDKVKQALIAANGLYHRLVLLAGETGSNKTNVLRKIAKDLDTTVINLNLALSNELLDMSAKQRSLRLQGIFRDIADKNRSPIIFDNLEILFDTDLKQDPLRLLQDLSRNHTVLASWSGSFNGQRLIYSETGHSEYRRYETVDALIVSIDGTATIDSVKNNIKAGQV